MAFEFGRFENLSNVFNLFLSTTHKKKGHTDCAPFYKTYCKNQL